MTDSEGNRADPQELEHLVLFKRVELQSVRGLLENCPVKELKKDEILIHAGKTNQFLYLLLSGQLRVHLKLNLDPVAILDPGEFVGELSLIDQEVTSAYVVADKPSRVLVMDEKVMWCVVDASPVDRNLLFVLSQRLRKTDSLLLNTEEIKRQYEEHAITDALTGLYNRRWCNRMLPRLMQRARIGQEPLTVLLIDIDGFKWYNTRGYFEGDQVLYNVAKSIQETMRPGELIIRYGGDEFLVLLPDTDAMTGAQIAKRLHASLAKSKVYDSEDTEFAFVTVSIGVAEMRAEDEPEALIQTAANALREAKQRGGNQVVRATHSS